MSDAAQFDIFAITAPGLEPVCAAELATLGIAASPAAEVGGVAWRGPARSVYRANLECRTASRIVVRVGEFRARTFAELERAAAKLDWSRFLPQSAEVTLRVTCRKSKLYHDGAVAERVERVLAAEVGARVARSSADDDEASTSDVATESSGATETPSDDAALLVIVRFMRDVCTVSVDTSGALLYQRGYRQAVAVAPLRETLAAAMLLAGDWDGTTPLVDPMCGSGVIPIEGALIARRIAPGLADAEGGRHPRRYAFEQWPVFDASVWGNVVDAARAAVLPASAVPIIGCDRDAGAIRASLSNAARAGVEADIEFRRAPLTALEPPAGVGHLVTNPPYGVRVGDARNLQPLYAAVGRTARERLAGWSVVMLAASPRLVQATGLPFDELLSTRNGGIAVSVMRSHVAAAAVARRGRNGVD